MLEEVFATGQRLVTLTGIGGGGKTRLAFVYAAQSRKSVIWVDLSGVNRIEDAVTAVASALGQRQRFSGADDLGEALARLGPALVVLDACEHLAPLSGPTVGRWLAQAPKVQFLATSRLPLGLAVERIVRLAPLDSEASLELLVSRAKLVDVRVDSHTDRAALADVVLRLEGIPLAIELAAARLQTLSLVQLQARLTDRFRVLRSDRRDVAPRHATMESTLDWSWALLTPLEQAAIAQCTVFHHAFTVDAAEAVLELTGDVSVLDVLQALHAHGLLRSARRQDHRILSLLDVVREYVSRHLSEEERSRVEERHAAYYLAFVRSKITPSALTRYLLDGVDIAPPAQVDNLESIVRRTSTQPTPRAEAALGLFALLGSHGPAPRVAKALFDAQEGLGPDDGLLAARLTLAMHHANRFFGTSHAAALPFNEAVRQAQHAGEGELAALLLFYQGRAALRRGETAEAAKLYDTALAMAHRSGDPATIAQCVQGPALQKFRSQPVPVAALVCAELVEVAERVGYRHMRCIWLNGLSMYLFEAGQIDEAWRRATEALVLAQSQDDGTLQISVLANMIEFAIAADRGVDAQACLAKAMALAESVAVYDPLGNVNRRKAWLAIAEDRLDDAERDLLELRHSSKAAVEGVVAKGRAYVALLRGQMTTAVQRLEVAEQLQRVHPAYRSDRAFEMGFRGFGRAALGDVEGARKDQQAAHEEAARWDCHHYDVTLQLLDAAIDVELQTPRSMRRATSLLSQVGHSVAPYIEVRIAKRLLQRSMAQRASVTLRVGPEVEWVQVNAEAPITLLRSPLQRRLLTALLQAHASAPATLVPRPTLLKAGWPDDPAQTSVLENRLWVALSKMRRVGFEAVLEHIHGGYRIVPSVVVIWM